MGRREADSRGAMNSSERSELGCLQDSASSSSSSQHGADRLRRTAGRDPCSLERAATAAPAEVKKHLHKHNLKHRYEVMETLGKGTYGKVKKAVEKASLRTVAIKSIRKDRITEDLERIHIQREIEITSFLCHPNVIRFHEVFESRDKIVIVMEFASRGELYDYIKERRRLPETEARSIFRQITSAVHYCHKNGVVHRDLKLENILLDQDLNVKLADFGLSNNFHRDSLLQTYCGSPLYASPEIVKGLPYVGPEVDCWALGVLLYALVYSSMPFDGTSHAKLTEQISHGRYHRPNPPSDACPLIDWLLTVRVQERATIEDVANHWWVNWGYEQSVCDCPSSPYQECPSPLLARYIDWQNQAAPNMTNDPGCLSSHFSYPPHVSADPFFFSSSLKPNCGAAGGKVCGGILSLRKSRKENAIPQTVLGSCGDTSTTPPSSTNEKRKPKGILKHQRSLDSVFHSSPKEDPSSEVCNTHSQPYRTQILGHTPSSILSTNLKPSSAFKQPSSKMPKKGILKNLYVRESSFDSFSEKEGCGEITKEGAAGHSHYCQQHTSLTSAESSPNMHTEAVRRRKGILKRNGKFSQSLDLPDDSCSSSSSTTAVLPEALQQLLQAAAEPESRHSRPSSVVSEDSLFSSDSYDLLDLSTQAHRKIFSHEMHHHACSSEENLEQLRTDDYEVVEDA